MKANDKLLPDKYTTRNGRVVSRSKHHDGLWIIDCADGKTFFTIHATDTQMRLTNPPVSGFDNTHE